MISFRRNSVYFQVNSYSIPIEFDSTKIESNSTRVEFDSTALKQGFFRLRLDFYFLILTDRKNRYKIYLLNKLFQSQEIHRKNKKIRRKDFFSAYKLGDGRDVSSVRVVALIGYKQKEQVFGLFFCIV